VADRRPNLVRFPYRAHIVVVFHAIARIAESVRRG
jgi:hypothetical protein